MNSTHHAVMPGAFAPAAIRQSSFAVRHLKFLLLAALLALLATVETRLLAGSLGTAFTYQGRLTEGGVPATGWYAMRFTLWDDATRGQVLGEPQTDDRVEVTNGLFTVVIDFGANVLGIPYFHGEARWLQVGVDRYRGSNYVTLLPRQAITPTPYAIYAPDAGAAASVPASGLTGVLPDARLSTNVALLDSSPTFNGTVTANYELVSLRLQVGLWCESGPTLSTVAGGLANTNLGSWSFLGGGTTNVIQTNATRAFLGAGAGNVIQAGADHATLGGSLNNTNGADFSTVPGGAFNAALGAYSFAAGHRAKAEHPGAFVWADSTAADFRSSRADQFAARVNGGVWVQGSGDSTAPQLTLRQTDSADWARLRLSVAGVSDAWDIAMQPDSTPDLRFSTFSNSITFGFDGRITANGFVGNGAALTGLNASAFTTGTVADARLSTNVALLDTLQRFTAWKYFDHLQVNDGSGTNGAGGSIQVGSMIASPDAKLVKFGNGGYVSIGENGADDRMELKAATFAFLPSTGNGWVGLGKVNPATALDVNGTVTATGLEVEASRAASRLRSTNGASVSLLEMRNTAAGAATLGAINFNDSSDTTPGQILYATNAGLTLRVGGAERMRVTPEGNVGIGTATPAWALDIRDGQAVGRFISTNNTGVAFVELRNLAASAPLLGAINFNNSANTTPGQIAYGTNSGLTFHAGGSERVRVTPEGNVGINASDPQTSLQVNAGSSTVAVDGQGRLGLGTDSPSEKLHLSAPGSKIRFPNGTVQSSAPFADAAYLSVAGTSTMPAPDSTAFVTAPVTIRIVDQSQRVFVMAQQTIKFRTLSGGLSLFIGYRVSGSGSVPTKVGAGMECYFDDQGLTEGQFTVPWLIAPFSLSAILSNLAPGYYEVGMVGVQGGSGGDGFGAGNGAVTAFVF